MGQNCVSCATLSGHKIGYKLSEVGMAQLSI